MLDVCACTLALKNKGSVDFLVSQFIILSVSLIIPFEPEFMQTINSTQLLM